MRRDCQRAATSQRPHYSDKETKTETVLEMEKEKEEEKGPTSETESSKESLVFSGCRASLIVKSCGDGLGKFDLRTFTLARQRFTGARSSGHQFVRPGQGIGGMDCQRNRSKESQVLRVELETAR